MKAKVRANFQLFFFFFGHLGEFLGLCSREVVTHEILTLALDVSGATG